MSAVTKPKLDCPLCSNPLDGDELAKHLKDGCPVLVRDGEYTSPSVRFDGCAPVAIALAPGGGGYGYYVLAGETEDGTCLYYYAGSPGPS